MPIILLEITVRIFGWLIELPMWKQVAFFAVSFAVLAILFYLVSLL
jgi:hypothetical protein